MQDRAERGTLLKQINETLAEVDLIETEIAQMRRNLSNSAKQFRITPASITLTALIAFRQRLGKLSESYLDLEAKTYAIQLTVDKIQP